MMKQTGSRIPVKTLVYASLSVAIVFVTSRLLSFPGPVPPGYINLGDAAILAASAFFGPVVGMIAGAFGSAFSDLTASALIFAPVTFVIKGLEGLVAGIMFKKHINKYITVLTSVLIMVAGYFLAETFILGLFDKTFGFTAAVTELPLNLIQAAASGMIFILIDIVKRIKK